MLSITSTAHDLVFKVERSEPELVIPAKATPHEFKQLSDMDAQENCRFLIPMIQFYEHDPNMEGKDPVKVIKKAVAKTLVFYYPLAGRLRECFGKKLFVECTGEGILFIEANADVTLQQFLDIDGALQPPFPCMDQLLYDDPNSNGIFDSPLLLIQVTRLKCNGFIFAIRFNRTMGDAMGMVQFLNALAELARGALAPSILPVWERALLNARNPPKVTCYHHGYDQVSDTKHTTILMNNNAQRSFFFGPTEIMTIRKTLPTHLRHFSTPDILSAYIWRVRTIALQLNPEEQVCFFCPVNLRTKFDSFPLGYYGNLFVFPAAVTTAGKLSQNPLNFVVELIEKAKVEVTEEYVKSMVDLLVIERPRITSIWPYLMVDLTEVGFEKVDFGWGNAVYGGPGSGKVGVDAGFISFFIPFENKKREKGVLVPICLPESIMERFVVELEASLV